MFAALEIPREPLSLESLPGAARDWVVSAGNVAALGLLLWGIAYLVQRPKYATPLPRIQKALFVLLLFAGGLAYFAVGIILLASTLGMRFAVGLRPTGQGTAMTRGDQLLLAGGAFAILATLVPLIGDMITRISVGRVWALAKLSLKEAFRSKVLLVFAAMALIFLFADWFVPYKAEDQVRNYVKVVYWSMTPLFLMTASLLGAFSIPADIKSLSIHTIVTKPVEKFEIVLGRFIGYAVVITGGLIAVTLVSMAFVDRGINPDAQQESFHARVPIFGELLFYRINNSNEFSKEGKVGARQTRYRTYIGGSSALDPKIVKDYAVWQFDQLPKELAQKSEPTKFEFTFDIFRLSKGKQNKGIFCTFLFADGSYKVEELETLVERMHRERIDRQRGLVSKDKIDEEQIKKYGIYEATGVQVTDFHTQYLDVPTSLFQKLLESKGVDRRDGDDENARKAPTLQVLVSLDRENQQQMLGVAKRDLYILNGENPFMLNFVKGIFALWTTFMLVLGVAVACSTYLSGVISWLATLFLVGTGQFTDFIKKMVDNKLDQGGPLESMYRIVNHTPVAVRVNEGAGAAAIQGTDNFFRWIVGQFLNLIPDMSRYDLYQYVANGFDISWGQMLLLNMVVPMLAYLIPWAVLAYFLMKSREIANPT